ncbi:MAG: hypothetical protein MUC81_00205 [Bacteroidia bacterium]|jgi:hypothetical protein|nr:hypothetical protein [Bacteroidia bacterium]
MSLFRNQNNEFEKRLQRQLNDTEFNPAESLWSRIDAEVNRPEFEQKVEGKIGNYSINPNPSTWEIIESQLPPEPTSSRKLTWWYAGAVFLFISSIVLGLYLGIETNDKSTASTEIMVDERTNDLQKQAVENMVKSKPSVQSEPLPENISVEGINTETFRSNNQTEKKKLSEVNTLASKVYNVKKTKVSGRKSKADRLYKPLSNRSDFNSDNQNKSNNKSIGNKETKEAGIPKLAAITNNTNDPASFIVEQEKTNSDQKHEEHDSSYRETSSRLVASTSDSAQTAFNQQDSNQRENNNETVLDSKLSISITTGAHESFMILSSDNQKHQSSIDLRNQIESPKVGLHLAFLLNYELHPSFLISSGLALTTFEMNMNFGVTPAINPVKPETGASYTNLNDSILIGAGNVGNIRYSWNEIPIHLIWRPHAYKKVGFELQAGISYAFIRGIDVDMVSTNNVGVLQVSDKEGFPFFRNSLFGNASCGMSIRFNPQLSLIGSGYVKYSISNMVKQDNWIAQRPYMIGFALTLRKEF